MADEKCPNCGALGTVGDPHDADCPYLPVYAAQKADKATCVHARAARHLVTASVDGSRRTYKYYCIDCDVWSSEPIGPWVEIKATPLVSGNSLDDRLSRIETLLTQADEVYGRALGDDVRGLKVMLAEALARKPLFVADSDPVEDPKPAVDRSIDEAADRITKVGAHVKTGLDLDSAALDSHERRLLAADIAIGHVRSAL